MEAPPPACTCTSRASTTFSLRLPRSTARRWRRRPRSAQVASRSRPIAPRRRGIEQRKRLLAQLGRRRCRRARLLRQIVRTGKSRQRHPHLRASIAALAPRRPARERDLGYDQRGRREAGPVRCAAALGRERKASHRDRPAAEQALGRIGHRGARQLAPAVGHSLEAPRPRGAQLSHFAQGRQRRPAAVGLLEHEPMLAGAPGSADDGARIDVGQEGKAERRQDLSSRSPRALDRRLQSLKQPVAILRSKLERRPL